MRFQRVRHLMLAVALCAGASGCLELLGGNADEEQLLGHHAGTLIVRAFVDGRDVLTIDGDRLTWSHLDSDTAAVGRWNGNRPTIVNDVAWYPDWDGATNFRAPMTSEPRIVSYVPAIPRYRDTKVSVQRASGGRLSGVTATLLPRHAPRDPIRLLIDNAGSDYNEKWVEVTLAWQTSDP